MAKHKSDHPHSSSISCCEHDDETNEMHITFASGGKHCFKDVPHEVYQEMIKSDSLGSHFHKFIRRKYSSVKVD